MPIEPCWPRTPYTLEIHEDDIVPLCAPDGDSPSKGLFRHVSFFSFDSSSSLNSHKFSDRDKCDWKIPLNYSWEKV